MSGVEGWIEWHGGYNPVPGQMVQVQWRDQSARFTPDDSCFSDAWQWGHHDMYCDIIAYRVVTPAALSAIEGGGGQESEAVEHLRRCVQLVPEPGAIEAAERFLARTTPPATPIAGGLTDLGVHVPADWLQGIWNMGNDALKRLPSDPQGALVSLTEAMMALHPLISENCKHGGYEVAASDEVNKNQPNREG